MVLRISPACAALACLALCLPACTQDHHFTVLGYTTKPNYETKYRTVRVPVFKNRTIGAFRQGLEFDLTREVVNQIEQKTPYKVVSDTAAADTELLGTVSLVNKLILNRNQLNEIREAQTLMTVELIWRDVKTGEILSNPAPATRLPPLIQQAPFQMSPGQAALGLVAPISPPIAPLAGPAAAPILPVPTNPLAPGIGTGPVVVPPPPPTIPAVVLVQSLGDYIPELGQSTTTALQQNIQRLATQIVSMMEKPW